MLMKVFEWVWALPLFALYTWWCAKAINGLIVLIRMSKKGWKISFILNYDDEVAPLVAWVVIHALVICAVSFFYWYGNIGGT